MLSRKSPRKNPFEPGTSDTCKQALVGGSRRAGFRATHWRSDLGASRNAYGVRPALRPFVHVVRLSSKGQIVIPKEVRRRHKLDRNTDLVLQEEGDILVLRKKRDVERILKDQFYPLLRASERSLAELWDNPEDDVWNDV